MVRPAEILRFDRVELRRWRAADADVVDRVVTESLDHLIPWMPWAAEHSRDTAVGFVTRCEQEWAEGQAYNYAITVGGSVIGSCGLMRRIGPGGLEIGYWIHPAWTGQGLVTMSASALLRQAFELPDVDLVEIHHDEANASSEAVPRRLGFTEVGRRAVPDGPASPGEAGIEVLWRLRRLEAGRIVPGRPARHPANPEADRS
ncbi:GNAT family N-acetyltransferase [Streptomyces meridianus]|uniref:GNAT family N-acetyltransferase n=1 Tax=Streptomyces meridianus TaxID=2938945 RepID=A0ABT0XDR8_9ACTN|nr:GNAT family N-acetyltransferase [Streptomyces meridianus]MCM2580068.1 GNAT family N-acetyltransferase [Streptomyces meridianus]